MLLHCMSRVQSKPLGNHYGILRDPRQEGHVAFFSVDKHTLSLCTKSAANCPVEKGCVIMRHAKIIQPGTVLTVWILPYL